MPHNGLLLLFAMLPNSRKSKNRKKKVVRIVALVLLAASVSIASGYFFAVQKKQEKTVISPLAREVLGKSAFDDDSDTSYIKEKLSKIDIDLTSIVASGSSYRLLLKDGEEVIFSSQKSLDSQISSLQFITLHLTMEGRRFHRLDLRFDKPVIVF